MSYNVYLITSNGMPRNRHALFVETNSVTSSGHIFQVTGNIQNGMAFEDKPGHSPDQQPTFHGKTFLGTVQRDYKKSFKEVCLGIQPPKKQFDGPRRRYLDEPIRRCQEWTSAGVLVVEEILLSLFATTREES
ncbi:conserved hypothetical protein [Histoplasma capsulatum var. duboisii H88]|uniref:Uncharacterized protein n=1 Tax=Ajellomyces capsulatus (strain H88) TaxID=544711 RepID=F0USZ9_AJEC8|nr:conserved hypothetical protein [Histoplasma capsulatum var. duboisii H88]QSS54620.1 hypothetical protein I7I53_02226 [Histoplasma capsulatum var. duboisii H88]